MKLKKLFRFAFFILIVYLFFKLGSAVFESPAKPGDRVKHLTNRIWIHHLPKSERDLVPQLLFLDAARQHAAVAGAASRWRMALDFGKYKLEGADLHIEFPQENVRGSLSARTWACSDAPKPLDLCLELAAGDQSVVYYSKKTWKVREDGSMDTEGVIEAVTAPTLRAAASTKVDGECPDCVTVPGEVILDTVAR